MNNFIKTLDDMPFILKLLFALPVLDIIWAIYRIAKGAETKNTLMLVAGILWIFFGCVITWLIDFVSVILCKKVVVLA